MLKPLVIGMSVVVVNVIVQTLTVAFAVRYLARKFARDRAGTNELREFALLSVVVVLMYAGHLVQIGVWAVIFEVLGEFDGFSTAVYHSSVNYTTLGYGDIVMSERWRLLGALEAGNGVLMFGVSTALFFSVLSKLVNRRIQMARRAGHGSRAAAIYPPKSTRAEG